MQSVLRQLAKAGGLLAILIGHAGASAAPPAEPQGVVTANTYNGDVRLAIINGANPSPDGTFYPGIAEIPFDGYTGLGSTGEYSGDPSIPPGADIRNNYTMRLRFYWHAPRAGQVQFAIASDDPGNLFISTDADPANKREVAVEPQWNGVRDFAGGDPTFPTRRTIVEDGQDPSPRPSNWSPFITVTANQVLYVEAVAAEFGGGDNLAVAVRYSDDPEFLDDDMPIHENISSVDRADLTKAAAVSVLGNPAGFSVAVVNGIGAGATTLNASTVQVQLDGAAVQTTTTETPGGATVAYAHTGVFEPASTHTVRFTAKDSGGNDIVLEQSFTVDNYALLRKEWAIPRDDVNTNERGFRWRVFQNAADVRTTNAKGEEALAGLLVDVDGNPLPNHADPFAIGNALGEGQPVGTAENALIEFEIETVVNWDEVAGSNGAFTPDEQMPGIPGIEFSTDGIAGEIFTYLDLPAGLVTMGVNSDDGFKTTAGQNPADAATAVILGEFNGGRGAADTIFQFVVEEAGIYPIRTIWEEGGGGANIEWFTVNNGTKVLINDDENGGIRAYRSADFTPPPPVAARVPAPGATGVALRPQVSVVWDDPDELVDEASIRMKINGQDVTPEVDRDGDRLTASATPAADFPHDTDVPVEVTATSAGSASTFTWTFTTQVDLAKEGTLFIETEDFDFDGGKYDTENPIGIPAGPYTGGTYQDLGDGLNNDPGNVSFGVDYFESNPTSDQAVYRPNTAVEAGKSGDTAGIGFDRGSFDVEVNHVVGWNDPGDWYNYTREWPTPPQTYKAWVRASSGGLPIHLELAQITEGAGTADQTKQKLGEFRPGRATAGWDGEGTYEIFPLLNDDGSRATFTLGGVTTLRLTTLTGNNDTDFLMFQETSGPPPGSGTFTSIGITGGQVVIEFTGSGLQSATAVTGPWTDVPGATSPHSVSPTDAARYFRFAPSP